MRAFDCADRTAEVWLCAIRRSIPTRLAPTQQAHSSITVPNRGERHSTNAPRQNEIPRAQGYAQTPRAKLARCDPSRSCVSESMWRRDEAPGSAGFAREWDAPPAPEARELLLGCGPWRSLLEVKLGVHEKLRILDRRRITAVQICEPLVAMVRPQVRNDRATHII